MFWRQIPLKMMGNTMRVRARVTGQVAPVMLAGSSEGTDTPTESVEEMHGGPTHSS